MVIFLSCQHGYDRNMRKVPDELKRQNFTIGLADEEKATYAAQAARHGRTLAAHIRHLLNDQERRDNAGQTQAAAV